MDTELFIKVFKHLPAIYPVGDSSFFLISGYSFDKINVTDVSEVSIYACLQKVALQICAQTDIKMPKDHTEEQSLREKPLNIMLNGRWATFSRENAMVIDTIVSLDPIEKIELVELTTDQMHEYLHNALGLAKTKLRGLLSKKWKWRTTGDLIGRDDLIDHRHSLQSITKMLTAKRTNIFDLNLAIDCFESDRTEVYCEEEVANVK